MFKNLLNRLRNNRVIFSLYSFLYPGSILDKDSILNDLENGYEKNVDVFGIINKLANKFANVKLVPYKNDEISNYDPLKDLFQSNTADLTLTEFKKLWYVYALTCGESLFHAMKLNGGNNAGKVKGKLLLLPPQYTEIISKGYMQPIGYYTLCINVENEIKLKPEEVYHVRLFPQVDALNGKIFRGLSPLRVAANVIESQNNGYELQKNVSKTGLPPGIIVDESLDGNNENRQKNLEKAWRRKQTNESRRSLPVFASGKLQFVELGYKSLKDIQTIESSQHGLRVLCNVLAVPSVIFNDVKSSTYNNVKSAYKALYSDRIMPDMNQFIDIIDMLFSGEGINYKADYTDIPELQMDGMDKAKLLLDGCVKGTVHENEFREVLHLDQLTEEELDDLRANRDRLNITELRSDENSGDF